MAQEIRVDKDGFEGFLKEMTDTIGLLQDQASEIDRKMNNDLGTYWAGDAYENAMGVYESTFKEVLTTKLNETLTEFQNYMNTCRDEIINLDNILAGK